ncbi:thiamine phosphate synthase [Halobacillus massiliensis]|uniref:thiamine phosphate synthase n=1 Tax=Halobacillus massiliensis TaxID=1926286 RepID=UPI0009E5791B|nr:thiamine phosphate synthase [Halobacillus massiliensis]
MCLTDQLRKYLIMGSQNCERPPEEILQDAIDGGITAFQFREKGPGSLSGHKKLELGQRLRELCRNHDILFIVNDDMELVEPLEADGIHVGQDDQPAEELRRLYPDKIIGLSISNEEELKRSPVDVIDYLGAGPVYQTSTKVDAKEAVGVEWIQRVKSLYPNVPLVGIGGITQDNAKDVIRAGAEGVSFITAVTMAPDIKKAVSQL